jgi:hypothetical protein
VSSCRTSGRWAAPAATRSTNSARNTSSTTTSPTGGTCTATRRLLPTGRPNRASAGRYRSSWARGGSSTSVRSPSACRSKRMQTWRGPRAAPNGA